MDNWETQGSAVLGKSHLILNPQTKYRTGMIYNTQPITNQNWVIDVDVSFHSNLKTEFASDGFGIYILRDIDKKDVKDINYLYTKLYNGLAVLFDTRSAERLDGRRMRGQNMIYGIVSDG